MRTVCSTLYLLLGVLLASGYGAEDSPTASPFVIRVIDSETGRGIPLVELRTVHEVLYYTDSAGLVTITDPELQNTDVYFFISSHGYEYQEDAFGYRGAKFRIASGEEATVELKRINLAERLYRVTGAGLYDHSINAGRDTPLDNPLMNGRVFGSDSVLTAIWKGQLFWVWGDTNRPEYPLGNFHSTAAISDFPTDDGLDPSVGVNLRYFEGKTGFTKRVAELPGEGPTWLSGLVVLPDEQGGEHLVAHFVKVRGFLEIYRRGLCEWDEAAEEFREVLVFDESQKDTPHGHPFEIEEDGVKSIVFADPLPSLRIPATYEAWKDPKQYEPIAPEESFHDAVSGKRVKPHRGTITWNDHRQRWIMIFTEVEGKASHLGEVWYAEATSYQGPWERCVQILTHDHYSFYNPKQHPYFAKGDSSHLYFEGTYTNLFSKSPQKTPKYDYNQILYRLDLDDERLAPAHSK